MNELDTIDISILKTLQNEGRISNAALAERVGLSASACSRRLDILEKSGVIKGYHARLSHKALDYRMIAIVHISLSGPVRQDTDRVRGSGEALPQCAGLLSDERRI
jgi:Lrp/AsnC family leucine-responsive transcriptional regulator